MRYALRLGAGFGSQIAMTLMRWTPVPDGRHRLPDELGYEYRIADRGRLAALADDGGGTADAELEVVQHRLRIVDTGAPVQAAPSAVPTQVPTVQRPAGGACTGGGAGTAPAPVRRAGTGRQRRREAAPAAAAGDEITETVVGIVSQLTGYPPELLDVDLDLEADLGVDTVKQAEIFAAIREHYGVARDDSLKLRDFPTLTHVIGWIRDKTGATGTPTGSAPAAPQRPPRPRARRRRRTAGCR